MVGRAELRSLGPNAKPRELLRSSSEGKGYRQLSATSTEGWHTAASGVLVCLTLQWEVSILQPGFLLQPALLCWLNTGLITLRTDGSPHCTHANPLVKDAMLCTSLLCPFFLPHFQLSPALHLESVLSGTPWSRSFPRGSSAQTTEAKRNKKTFISDGGQPAYSRAHKTE